MKNIAKFLLLTMFTIVLSQLFSCKEPLPPKDASEYITPLEDGNTWVIHLNRGFDFPQEINGDTTYAFRQVYMTNTIDGDTIVRGKKCKKVHAYLHHNPTVKEGDTVYTSVSCPQIFPGAFYIYGHENTITDSITYYNYPEDSYAILMREVSFFFNPSCFYEENYVIKAILPYKTGGEVVYSVFEVIDLNPVKGEKFGGYEIKDVSTITFADGKERRMIEVGAKNNHYNTYLTSYWIEGIGSVKFGITLGRNYAFACQPTIFDKVVSFSTYGQVIYTAEEE